MNIIHIARQCMDSSTFGCHLDSQSLVILTPIMLTGQAYTLCTDL